MKYIDDSFEKNMKEYDKVIGIDPGASGGIAVFSRSGIGCSKMPVKTIKKGGKKINETDVRELAEILREQTNGYMAIVFIEKVQGWISDTEDNPGKRFRIQKMLANYEALKTAIIMSGIDLVEVPPRTWQTYLALVVKGMEKKERKQMYLNAARNYYPTAKVALWNSDAICLVQFGRMKLQFDRKWVDQKLGVDSVNGKLL